MEANYAKLWKDLDSCYDKLVYLTNLRLGELHHELGDLVVHVHHLEDGGAVVGNRDVVVGGHHHLVKTFWAKRGTQRTRHRLGGLNVRL